MLRLRAFLAGAADFGGRGIGTIGATSVALASLATLCDLEWPRRAMAGDLAKRSPKSLKFGRRGCAKRGSDAIFDGGKVVGVLVGGSIRRVEADDQNKLGCQPRRRHMHGPGARLASTDIISGSLSLSQKTRPSSISRLVFSHKLTVKSKMSLPPERINIKRRRQDDPVEALRKLASFAISSNYH